MKIKIIIIKITRKVDENIFLPIEIKVNIIYNIFEEKKDYGRNRFKRII